MNETLILITQICIIPIIAVITALIVFFVKKGMKKIADKTDSEELKVIVDVAEDTIVEAITTTSTAYTESLKGKNAFDKETQTEALNAVKEEVVETIEEAIRDNLPIITENITTYVVGMTSQESEKKEEE